MDINESLKQADFPKVTQEPIIGIDATPNEEYPLRILRTYRENCNCRFSSTSSSGEDEELDPFCKVMNEACEKRARFLDVAIEILEGKRRWGEGYP